MQRKYIIFNQSQGYIYSLRRKMFVEEGFHQVIGWEGTRARKGIFKVNGAIHRCAEQPGKVFNSSLWLTKRDDELAMRLFIECEQAAIDELTRRIEHHRERIKVLKDNA